MPPRKYALVGSSGAGKTTLVYQVAGLLKVAGVHVETVISGDRRLPFPADRLEDTLDAQAYVIVNQARLELDRSCTQGIDVVLSDRSVVDFLIYARETFPNAWDSVVMRSLEAFVKSWQLTYDQLFYVPMRAQYDTVEARPSESFARRVDDAIVRYLYGSSLPSSLPCRFLTPPVQPDAVAAAIRQDLVHSRAFLRTRTGQAV